MKCLNCDRELIQVSQRDPYTFWCRCMGPEIYISIGGKDEKGHNNLRRQRVPSGTTGKNRVNK